MSAQPAAPAAVTPDWSMRSWFDAFGSEAYAAFRSELEEELGDLEAGFGALGTLEPAARDAWAAWLLRLEDWSSRHGHLASYLGCLSAADARNEAISRDVADGARLRARLSKLFTRLRSRLGCADGASFEALVATPELAHARYFLGRLREEAERRMAPDLEELAADLEVTGLSAWGRLYDRVSGRLEFELRVSGEPDRRLPVSATRSLLGDPRAEVRRAALDGANEAWAAEGDVLASCLNAISGTRLELYRRRGIPHFLEPALFDAGITRATLDAMLEAVRSRIELPRRYLKRKARILGRERLGFHDLEAPLPAAGEAASIPWPDARAKVLAAFDRFHPQLGQLAARAFEERWIDHSNRPGKRPGGFCSTSVWKGESRIFMTYGGSAGDVSTLAHELGHAFHGAVMDDQRPWARRYPMTLAETASTFAEQVVHQAQLDDPAAQAAERIDVLDRRLQDAAAFMLNIPMRFSFECRVYEERADGELSAERLCTLMREEQTAWYGDSLDPEELDPWFWASKLHFYITGLSFYNFPYTFGYLLSLGLFSRALRDRSFLPHYESLLRQTGSAAAPDVVRDCLGEDAETTEFWSASLDLIESDLERFENEGRAG
jgi:oligoendopeptidase F